jgi:hypothetical protein
MIVYAITVLDVLGDPVLGNRRTPAIFTSLERAIQTVRENESDLADNNLYQYAVIEETLLNTVRPYIQSGEKLWFKHNTILDEFEQIDVSKVPPQISRLYGFGIG